KKTKSRTKEHVSFINHDKKIRSRDPDTTLFTFRFFLVAEDLKKTKWVPNKRNMGYPWRRGT
ncbi:MAG: hypothetical protein ABJ056_02650, partial [Halioglobus sp.]